VPVGFAQGAHPPDGHEPGEGTLSQLILSAEHFLGHALIEYMTRSHQERPHQGMGNIVLMPANSPKHDASMRYREPLGGLLQY